MEPPGNPVSTVTTTRNGISKWFLLWTVLSSLSFSACEKCIDCRNSRFDIAELNLLYTGKNQLGFTNGQDTVIVTIERSLSESQDEECGSYPVKPSCNSLGFVTLYNEGTDGGPIHNVERIGTQKFNNAWQCTDFQFGDTFFLNLDQDYQLTPRNNDPYQITTLGNYTFNKANLHDVQQVVLTQVLGNASELTRILFSPTYGVLELTYNNPSETWRQIP